MLPRNFSSETVGSEWKFTKACFILLFPLGVSFWSYVCHTFLRFYLCVFLRSLLINIHTRIFLWLSSAKVYQTCMSYIRTSQRMVPLIFFAFPFRWILVCFFSVCSLYFHWRNFIIYSFDMRLKRVFLCLFYALETMFCVFFPFSLYLLLLLLPLLLFMQKICTFCIKYPNCLSFIHKGPQRELN